MDYVQSLEFLDRHINLERSKKRRLPVAGQTEALSLEPMRKLLEVVGNPHETFRSIHVTGTNGKGSVSAIAASLIEARDLSVGLYSSPHFVSINERVVANGQPISDESFAAIVTLLASVEEMIDVPLSWFELMTALAFIYFSEQAVDVAVVEVGMLGRYDATNVITSDVAVITNVGKDHTDGSPGWRRKVAAEKAGICKPTSHIILGSDMGDCADEFTKVAASELWQQGDDFILASNQLSVGGRVLDITTPGQNYEELFVPLHGHYQGVNVATAVAAVEAFFSAAAPQELVEHGLSEVHVTGRMQALESEPLLIVDSAHNKDALEALTAAMVETFPRVGSWVLVIGLLQGRDVIEQLQALDIGSYDGVICCEPDSPRALSANELAAAVQTFGIDAEVVRSPIEAVGRAKAVVGDNDLVLVTGSAYVVGEILDVAKNPPRLE